MNEQIPEAAIDTPTGPEVMLLSLLGSVNDAFIALPIQHPEDQDDFRRMIHRLQDMVAARSGLRAVGRVR